ncbi:nucleoside triphosphate pyrophosphohydrolase family protein [Sulfobacillus thermosulfidooxidans]|uniref:nucleoside triphosphate pyrophosphohydrolase family protein n=1 Tax=Sulfobacillus thermosulfidooxidans TaxID=28034 RepID=UPI0006B5EE9B|nr:nucleoside triphosphate pyrophosphohydrolase family protein [Sulfobacillus thermosulfidooxidans]
MNNPLAQHLLTFLRDISNVDPPCFLTPSVIARAVQADPQDVFDTLVALSDHGLVTQHFDIRCPCCSYLFPYPAPEIDQAVICPACHHTFPIAYDHLMVRFALVSASSPMTISDAYNAVQTFHARHGFPVATGTRDELLLRLALMQEELGEIASVVTKAPRGADHTGFTQADWEHLTEELTDLLYLWLGTAVHCGWTPEEISQKFHAVHHKNMGRAPRHTALQHPHSESE